MQLPVLPLEEKGNKMLDTNNELKQLLVLAKYYRINRQAGHTTAMLEGALNVDNALVLTHNQMFADTLKRQSKGNGTQFISPYKTDERLLGQKRPLLIDHHHLANLIEALPDIYAQQQAISELKGAIWQTKHLIETYPLEEWLKNELATLNQQISELENKGETK